MFIFKKSSNLTKKKNRVFISPKEEVEKPIVKEPKAKKSSPKKAQAEPIKAEPVENNTTE